VEADNGTGSASRTFYVDVLLILERDGCVLLAERSDTGYADGAYNLPSGKLEPGEDVVAAVIREAREEIGIRIERDAVRAVHVMHHRAPEGQTRVGWFFTAAGIAQYRAGSPFSLHGFGSAPEPAAV
jgi:8-oxo-dGTP pyrophosphatase MutT (NUDIX family)